MIASGDSWTESANWRRIRGKSRRSGPGPQRCGKRTITHQWNHGLGEIVTAVMDAGMNLSMLVEHDSVPWEALPGRMERSEAGEWRLADRSWRLPHSYTLQAVKRC